MNMESSKQQIDKHTEWSEVKIKVPWGHLAGKWWGSKAVQPILALHGWQDNAGTFDTLIPLLSTQFSFLAIDLPGHGRSSFFPEGMMYHYTDFVNVVMRLMDEMKWKKVSIIGHSMGGVVGFWCAAMFPDKIDFLIAIDTLKPPQIPKERYWSEIGNLIKSSMLIDERNRNDSEPPSYSYDQCIERVYIGSESVDREKCRYLLARNTRESKHHPGKYYFSRDGRLKFMNKGLWPQNFYVELASLVRIPHLFINALDAPINESLQNYRETIGVLKKNPLFEYREVRGRHHVHLNQPESVCGIIEEFLNKYDPCEQNAVRAKL